MSLMIQSAGQKLQDTNYFESEWAQLGAIFVSINAGAIRLLIPPALTRVIDEMSSAREVVFTRGAVSDQKKFGRGRRLALEIMFEDGSKAPLMMVIGVDQVDRFPAAGLPPRDDLRCLVYTRGPALALDLPARYRERRTLPCLEPWSGR
jgi:hypothetical protein